MSYTIVDYTLMFVSNFFIVFLLGLQSRNVVAGKYLWAILTSLGISIANFTFIKFAATGDPSAFVLCASGACFGIAASIWFYERVVQRRFATGGFAKAPDQMPLFGATDAREHMVTLTPEQRRRISDGIINKLQLQGATV